MSHYLVSKLLTSHISFLKESAQDASTAPTPPTCPAESNTTKAQAKVNGKSKGKVPRGVLGETGIRRYEIIGTHKFQHDDRQLDKHLTHVLKWWHGQRKPEGVSLEHSYRCS